MSLARKKNSILDLKMASLSAFWALFFFTDQLFGLNAKRRLAGKKYCKTSLLGLQSKYITRGCVAYSYKIN